VINALIVQTKISCYCLYIPYVARNKIYESFIGFYELKDGVTGEAISSAIEKAISDCHLHPTLLCGQAYNG